MQMYTCDSSLVPRPHPQKGGKGLVYFELFLGPMTWQFWILSRQSEALHVTISYDHVPVPYP